MWEQGQHPSISFFFFFFYPLSHSLLSSLPFSFSFHPPTLPLLFLFLSLPPSSSSLSSFLHPSCIFPFFFSLLSPSHSPFPPSHLSPPPHRLELFLDVTFQYFIRPDELQPLHDAYDRQYNDIIISRAESVIKSVAPRFNTMDYFTVRSTIERDMAQVLFEDLGGTGCCDSYCSGDLLPDYRIEGLDCANCTLACAVNRQRFNVDVR